MDLVEIIQTLKDFLKTDSAQLWLLDERVRWEGMEEEFQQSFEENDADFLATEVRSFADDPGWTWWHTLQSEDGGSPPSSSVAALLPLMRVNRQAAQVILQGITDGWSGHPEALIPTLVNRAGLLIEDIGGKGSFTPEERIGRWYDERTWHWKGPVEHVPGKLHFPLISRFHAKAPDTLASDPRVAFLFLTRGDIHHREIWREYLEQADGRARIFAHTKDSSLLAEDSLLRDHQIAGKVETAWGHISLVHATLALLNAALEDAGNTHFVLVSESCIPVRPFGQLRVNLRRDDRSRVHVWSLEDARRGGNREKVARLEQLTGISKDFAYFQEQWMCLSREDALIVTEKDWTPCFEHVYAADECYFATVLAAAGKPLPRAVANRPLTRTEWNGGAHPREFGRMTPRDVAAIAESGCFFARKFARDSDIGRYRLHLDQETASPNVQP